MFVVIFMLLWNNRCIRIYSWPYEAKQRALDVTEEVQNMFWILTFPLNEKREQSVSSCLFTLTDEKKWIQRLNQTQQKTFFESYQIPISFGKRLMFNNTLPSGGRDKKLQKQVSLENKVWSFQGYQFTVNYVKRL